MLRLLKRIGSAVLVTAGWVLSLVFFRAQSFADAMLVFSNLGPGNTEALYQFGLNGREFTFVVYTLVGMMIYEIIAERYGEKLLERFYVSPVYVRWSLYLALTLGIIFLGSYGAANDNSFIYFQF